MSYDSNTYMSSINRYINSNPDSYYNTNIATKSYYNKDNYTQSTQRSTSSSSSGYSSDVSYIDEQIPPTIKHSPDSIKGTNKQTPQSSKTDIIVDYSSSWFETENNLKIDDYLRQLFTISHKYLASNCEKDSIKGIIVPHAGLKYSGLCSASSYYALRNRNSHIKRIILFCTNHYETGIISTNCKNIIKSYGDKITKSTIEIDTKTIKKITPYLDINNPLFENEHSFFMQIPFIEAITTHCKLIPIIIGNLVLGNESTRKVYKIFSVLLELLKDENTVVICTSDLSHINGQFETKIHNFIYHTIRARDSEILKFIYNKLNGVKDKKGMDLIQDYTTLTNNASCGMFSMYLFAKLMNLYINKYSPALKSGSTSSSQSSSSSSSSSSNVSRYSLKTKKLPVPKLYTRTICYYSSIQRDEIDIFNFNPFQLVKTLDINDTTRSSVSYAGIAITTQPYIDTTKQRRLEHIMSNFEKLSLLTLAREQLFNSLVSQKGGKTYPSGLLSPIYSQVFQLDLGVFVTIHKNNGELRGCVGIVGPSDDIDNTATIGGNIRRYVEEAAIRDSRFQPMDISEYNDVNLNITLLNELKEISLNQYFGDKFILGSDAILVKTDGRSGFFLPSVAKEFNYDKKTLLEQLCMNKIGEKNNCYVNYDAKLYYNEGYDFSETEFIH